MEIGSEFQYMDANGGIGFTLPENVNEYTFTFSGRTAIETVIRNEPNIRRVLMPSYCCDSMIAPFRNADIDVCFYPVNYLNGELVIELDISALENVDCLFWSNYFGFYYPMPNLDSFIKSGGLIIEDITHSFLSHRQYNKQSTYLVASLRKWGPFLCGGYCGSVRGNLPYRPGIYPEVAFLDGRRAAMHEKQQYLDGDESIAKENFLERFSICNTWLGNHYSGLMMDDESKDFFYNANQSDIYQKRCINAEALYRGLDNCDNIEFLFNFNMMECPLFVPIILKNKDRDALQKKLINQNIYCPVHWPKPIKGGDSNLYDIELSIICDQRYDVVDMEKIISVICKS